MVRSQLSPKIRRRSHARGTYSSHCEYGGVPYAHRRTGGGTLRIALALRVTSVEVQQIVTSMGPIESMHFQTWHEKAGKRPRLSTRLMACHSPTNDGIDPTTGASGTAVLEMFQTNLIMPEPCPFISTSLPACSVIRPTNTTGAATGALKFLTAMGLFIGQSDDFFSFMTELANGRGRGPARHVTTLLQACGDCKIHT